MLLISLLILLIVMSFNTSQIKPKSYRNIVVIVFIYCRMITMNRFYLENIRSGKIIYNGLMEVNRISQIMEIFIYISSRRILFGMSKPMKFTTNSQNYEFLTNEITILMIFTTLGSVTLISRNNLITLYLGLELQSFSAYLLATSYRKSDSVTAAGLKYFLLGGLSSAIMLLGIRIIYYMTGVRDFESLNILRKSSGVTDNEIFGIYFSFGIMTLRLRFKVGAAPLHSWAPDVYNAVPTIITSWISIIPKISIIIIIFTISIIIFHLNNDIFQFILFRLSIRSLLVGTIGGLAQTELKRLLAFSSISHIGFILLSISIFNESSISALFFYLITYIITNINIFLILLRCGYCMKYSDIKFINEINGLYQFNRSLAIRFAISVLSMRGIPPLIGFFAKQNVIYRRLQQSFIFITIIAIIVSVISASYYLKLIQIMFFNNNSKYNRIERKSQISNFHAIIIARITGILIFYIFNPINLLNIVEILSLTIYN